jgi:hypothetical protein
MCARRSRPAQIRNRRPWINHPGINSLTRGRSVPQSAGHHRRILPGVGAIPSITGSLELLAGILDKTLILLMEATTRIELVYTVLQTVA